MREKVQAWTGIATAEARKKRQEGSAATGSQKSCEGRTTGVKGWLEATGRQLGSESLEHNVLTAKKWKL